MGMTFWGSGVGVKSAKGDECLGEELHGAKNQGVYVRGWGWGIECPGMRVSWYQQFSHFI